MSVTLKFNNMILVFDKFINTVDTKSIARSIHACNVIIFEYFNFIGTAVLYALLACMYACPVAYVLFHTFQTSS